MNERIKQLLVEARINAYASGNSKDLLFSEVWGEKFAELIVKECTTVIEFGRSIGCKEWNDAIDFVSNDIKEHFGVK